jgi:hypothetical protein
MLFFYLFFFSIFIYADEHTVLKGETLFSIAKKNNKTVEEIKILNNLNNENIFIGQKLKILNEEILSSNQSKKENEKIKIENVNLLNIDNNKSKKKLKKFETKFIFPIINGKIVNNYKGKLKIIASKNNRNVISSCNGKILFFGILENINIKKYKTNAIIIQCNDGNYIAYENLKEIEKFKLNERIVMNQILGECDKIQDSFFNKSINNECGINYSIISQNKKIYLKTEKMFIK